MTVDIARAARYFLMMDFIKLCSRGTKPFFAPKGPQLLRLGLILVVAAMTAMPASAAVSDTLGAREAACFEAKDWPCVFDDLIADVDTEEFVVQCAADQQQYAADACWTVPLLVYVAGIGAAETADNDRRKQISELGIAALDRLAEGAIRSEGELLFSALRYDACRSMNNAACMSESAGLIRLAYANGQLDEFSIDEMAEMLGEFGVRYPLDLALVMTEVAGMEKKE